MSGILGGSFLVDGNTGWAYDFDFSTLLDTTDPPYYWTVSSGDLPDGLTLDPGTGILSGTPTTVGIYNFTINVSGNATNGSEPYQIQVDSNPAGTPPAITNTTMPNGSKGAAYNQQLNATGGVPGYTFSITAGALPPGLAISSGGAITGTPTATGSFPFTATVTDSQPMSGSANLTITIPSLPSITNTSLPDGTVGVPYNAALVGVGGAIPYTFSIIAGTLPPGLSLASTGGITGDPTTAGSFSVTFQITDSNSPEGTGTKSFVITINPASILNPVSAMDDCLIIACEDGAIRITVPGQRHDEDYNGDPVGFLQQWNGVPGPAGPGAPLLQLGGATVGAKGDGKLNVTATDGSGNVIPLSSDKRPMNLSPTTETVRDFVKVGTAHSERFGIGLNNGGVIDAWFEAHSAVLWLRKMFSATTETVRDFVKVGTAHSERFGIGLNNGGVIDAWFEAHSAVLWLRKMFSARKG